MLFARFARSSGVPGTKVAPWHRFSGLRLLGALLSAGLLNLAIAPTSWWWLGAVALVPLLLACRNVSTKAGFGLGWLAGTVALGWGFSWLIDVVEHYSGLPVFAGLLVQVLFAGTHGLQWGIFGALAAMILRAYPHTGWGQSWRLAITWAALEVTFPNVFPTYLGMVWSPRPEAIAHAQWFGVVGVSASVILINGLLASVCSERRRMRKIANLVLAFALGLGLWSCGLWSLQRLDAQMEKAPSLLVGVVQGNFGIMTLAESRMRQVVLEELARESARLERMGAKLVIWGETAYPYEIRLGEAPAQDAGLGSPRRIRRGFSVPAIVGTVVLDTKVSEDFPFNSAWVLQSDGTFGDRFDKNYPLWFGEYAPWVDPYWYIDMVPGAYHISRGQSPGVLRVDDLRLGAMICYEDLLPHFVRETTQLGVHALVNLTNDSWFGDTAEPWQHLSLATLRAVENQRELVRAVNAGVSAHIDAGGRLLQATQVSDADRDGYRGAEGFLADVKLADPANETLFTRTGHLQVGLWLAGGLFCWWQARRRLAASATR